MIVRVMLYREDGAVLVENQYQCVHPSSFTWELGNIGSIVMDGFQYTGYTITLHGEPVKSMPDFREEEETP